MINYFYLSEGLSFFAHFYNLRKREESPGYFAGQGGSRARTSAGKLVFQNQCKRRRSASNIKGGAVKYARKGDAQVQ